MNNPTSNRIHWFVSLNKGFSILARQKAHRWNVHENQWYLRALVTWVERFFSLIAISVFTWLESTGCLEWLTWNSRISNRRRDSPSLTWFTFQAENKPPSHTETEWVINTKSQLFASRKTESVRAEIVISSKNFTSSFIFQFSLLPEEVTYTFPAQFMFVMLLVSSSLGYLLLITR